MCLFPSQLQKSLVSLFWVLPYVTEHGTAHTVEEGRVKNRATAQKNLGHI